MPSSDTDMLSLTPAGFKIPSTARVCSTMRFGKKPLLTIERVRNLGIRPTR